MKIIALILAACLAATPAFPQERTMPAIHYSPAENLEHIDIALIATASVSIDMAAYVLTDVAVIDALDAAARRGVKVRVYLDGRERAPKGRVAIARERLDASGAEIRVKPPGPLMHLKDYLVDGRVLRTGSANFSPSGLKRQNNALLIVVDAGQVASFLSTFETMWGP